MVTDVGLGTYVQAPVTGLQMSFVQILPSSHLGLYTHPLAGSHESIVHMLLSLQTTGVWTQPVAVLQLSVVQALLSLQLMAVPWHVYVG
jgi:hypothetical protein